MSYPPTNPGYPPSQPQGSYRAPGPSFAPAEAEPNKLPFYLTAAVVVLGLAAYLASFGPVFTVNAEIGPFGGAELTGNGGGYPIVAALVAALLAAVSLLPKARNYTGVVAAVAVLAVLLVIAQVVSKPAGLSIGWALWLILAFTLLEAIAAVAALLLEAGVITAPAPRPRYDQYSPYGPPPGGYYGQQPTQQQGPQQRPGYPSQYGGYSPGPTGPVASGPSAGGFGSLGSQGGPLGSQSGPPTPPTGFPSFSPPPSVGSGQPPAGGQSAQPSQPSPSQAPSPDSAPGPTQS